jgi:hypothetical protein
MRASLIPCRCDSSRSSVGAVTDGAAPEPVAAVPGPTVVAVFGSAGRATSGSGWLVGAAVGRVDCGWLPADASTSSGHRGVRPSGITFAAG